MSQVTQDNEFDELVSPENYTYYQREYKNKEIPTIKLNKIWRKYLEQELRKALYQACKATESVAVRSTVLSVSQRHQYEKNRYVYGKKTYYFFAQEAIPMKVFCKIKIVEGKLIYEQEDAF